jgi:hypothetical protein
MESIGLSLNKKKGKKNHNKNFDSPESDKRKPDVVMADVSGQLDRMKMQSSSGGKVFNPFAASKRSNMMAKSNTINGFRPG